MNKIFILLLCLVSGFAAASQPLTLAELIQIALENHPETRHTWWQAQRSAAALKSAECPYTPTVDVQAGIQHGRDFKFINGPNTTYTIAGTDLVLSFLLLDFGERRANVDAAKNALTAANWRQDWVIQKVMIKAIENGYLLLQAQEIYSIAQESCRDADSMFQAARQLNSAGLSPISDVYTSQAFLSQSKIEAAEQKSSLDIQNGKLSVSLGLPPDTQLQIAPVELPPASQAQKTVDLLTFAKQQRGDLAAKHADIAASLSLQERARASNNPKIFLAANAGTNHAFHDRAHGAQYKIGLNFDYPLFNLDHMYQNRIAYADTEILKEELAQLELDMALEILTYCNMVESARELLVLAQENLDNAALAYEAVMEKYKAGKERFSELSGAQKQLASARRLYCNMKTKLLTSLSNLAYASGTLDCYKENL